MLTPLTETLLRLRQEAASRRSHKAPYRHNRWARCEHCWALRRYKVGRPPMYRRLRSQSCQSCNRKGGLHTEAWSGWAVLAPERLAVVRRRALNRLDQEESGDQ